MEIIMLWFKNLMVYRLWREVSLRARRWKNSWHQWHPPCGSEDMAKMG
ncbi:hypothetical protein ACNKHK_01975 [Shigella flexneri]